MTTLSHVVSVGLAEHLVQMPATFSLIENTSLCLINNHRPPSIRSWHSGKALDTQFQTDRAVDV